VARSGFQTRISGALQEWRTRCAVFRRLVARSGGAGADLGTRRPPDFCAERVVARRVLPGRDAFWIGDSFGTFDSSDSEPLPSAFANWLQHVSEQPVAPFESHDIAGARSSDRAARAHPVTSAVGSIDSNVTSEPIRKGVSLGTRTIRHPVRVLILSSKR